MANRTTGIDKVMIRDLAEILNDTDLTDIEIEQGDLRIRVSRQITVQAAAPQPIYAQAPATAPAAAPAASAPAAVPASDPSKNAIPSPMVGTVYLSPEPGKPAFIAIGKSVKEGDTLFIVEAMKTMNAITAPKGGTVTEIHVTDGTPVEFGQTLCVIA